MTFLKDGDSINFQKASCTLDGCVKIYTSRVDSVASETGKLLSGLADSASKSSRSQPSEKQRRMNTNPLPFYWIDVPQDGEDGDADDDAERKMKRKSNRSEATLAKDFSSIKVKKLDLDFTVDPLFKKTSADFDEGGARGLLLNNLTVDRDCKIIFDASDAFADADDDEETNSPKMDESKVKKEANEDEMMQDAMDVDPAPEGTDNDKNTDEKIATDDDKVEVSRLKGIAWILITLLTYAISFTVSTVLTISTL